LQNDGAVTESATENKTAGDVRTSAAGLRETNGPPVSVDSFGKGEKVG
jgi:hypothetical protein